MGLRLRLDNVQVALGLRLNYPWAKKIEDYRTRNKVDI
jgi:hypothetical protein